MDVIRFSLKRKEFPVEVEQPDGSIKNYVLREMTGLQRDQFLDIIADKSKMDSAGRVVGMKNFTGLYAALLARSLFDSDDKPVDEKTIQSWPARVQAVLFEKAMDMNALGKAAEEQAKND